MLVYNPCPAVGYQFNLFQGETSCDPVCQESQKAIVISASIATCLLTGLLNPPGLSFTAHHSTTAPPWAAISETALGVDSHTIFVSRTPASRGVGHPPEFDRVFDIDLGCGDIGGCGGVVIATLGASSKRDQALELARGNADGRGRIDSAVNKVPRCDSPVKPPSAIEQPY